eukprot:TRINITY_DN9382_c0_g1_i1.p1 TRINITY_DN9382_c0_g1~~TRINITY_DN9382_c0_g1_i1.p1  ORF type:complete len:122 (-),score=12.97 TRINITY_DN9382_c0_g1_i1:242-607(-)
MKRPAFADFLRPSQRFSPRHAKAHLFSSERSQFLNRLFSVSREEWRNDATKLGLSSLLSQYKEENLARKAAQSAVLFETAMMLEKQPPFDHDCSSACLEYHQMFDRFFKYLNWKRRHTRDT